MSQRENEIKKACKSFEDLLRAQLTRCDEMKSNKAKTDFAAKDKIIVGLIGGDGIGPILVRETGRVLTELLKEETVKGKIELREIEGLTIENRLACGKAVPEDVMAAMKACDVLLKGPTTTPKGGTMGSANVALRQELDLYANVRPVSIPEQGIDWTFFRENTEGEYVLGNDGVEISGELGMDFKCTTYLGTKRIARAAFEFAKANGKTNVAIVTKANVIKTTDGLFSELCHEVAKDYPGITADDWYADIVTANLINPEIRQKFQVFVLPNLYGDIITDEAAQIQGGVGTAGSANLGDRHAMFEAIHGSAPRLIEEGLGDYADPRSVMIAAAMLLSHIGLQGKSDTLKAAINTVAAAGIYADGTKKGVTTAAFADAVLKELAK